MPPAAALNVLVAVLAPTEATSRRFLENETQSSRETKGLLEKKIKEYMICDGTGCLVAWSIWHFQEKHCSVGKYLNSVAILRTQEAKPFREVHLWNEVQPMSPLSLNHDHLIWSQNHVCTVLEGNSGLKQSFTILHPENKNTHGPVDVFHDNAF